MSPDLPRTLVDAARVYGIEDYWMAVYRRRWTILLVAAFAGVFSWYLSSRIEPRYESVAEFYVPQDVVGPLQGPEAGKLRVPGLKQYALVYRALLEGQDALTAVARRFPGKGPWDLGRDVDFVVTRAGGVRVYARDRVPETAVQVANAFIDYFTEFNSKIVREGLERSIVSVQTKLDTLDEEKHALEERMWAFQEEHRLGALGNAISQIDAERVDLEHQQRAARIQLRVARERVAALEARLRTEQEAYRRGEISAQLADTLRADLRRELNRAYVERSSLEERLAALESTSVEVAALIEEMPEKLKEFKRRQEAVARTDQSIASLRASRRNLETELLKLKDTVVVTQHAALPGRPVFPSVGLNVAVAVFGGLVVGVLYALFLDHLQRRRDLRRLEALETGEWVAKLSRELEMIERIE